MFVALHHTVTDKPVRHHVVGRFVEIQQGAEGVQVSVGDLRGDTLGGASGCVRVAVTVIAPRLVVGVHCCASSAVVTGHEPR